MVFTNNAIDNTKSQGEMCARLTFIYFILSLDSIDFPIRKGKRQHHLPGGGVNMDDKTHFVVYCIELIKCT